VLSKNPVPPSVEGKTMDSEGSLRVLFGRSLGHGDHRNRSRTVSMCRPYEAVKRMAGKVERISVTHGFHDILFIKVQRTLPVVSLCEKRCDRPRLIKGRQEFQQQGDRPVVEDPPVHRAHPSRNFRGRGKVSSMSFFCHPPPFLYFSRDSLASRASASTLHRHLPGICSFIITFLQSCLTSTISLKPIWNTHPSHLSGGLSRVSHDDGVGGSIHRLTFNRFGSVRRIARLDV